MQKYFDEIVKSIQESVQFDSSLTPAEPSAPFGAKTKACLEHFLSLAKRMGFETHDYDGYVGEVVFGEGKEFTVLAHLDVVPAGNGWTYPPFGGVIADGKLYGRGTMDDKGPAVICLYCLKALKDEGFMPKRKIKLIVGCNEESGWACMEHYKKVAQLPEEGFTPDAEFPVIYAEKGILHLKLAFPIADAPFTHLQGGSAANMVCDRVYALPMPEKHRLERYVNPLQNTALIEENGRFKGVGVSAHGSTPEKGANAFGAMLRYYAQENTACQYAYGILFEDALALKGIHDETGNLTFSPNVVEWNGQTQTLYVTVDCRIPATHGAKEVTHALKQAGIAYEVVHEQKALLNDKDGRLIQTLLKVYNEQTGKTAQPVAIGGGTYARVLPHGCGFGPQELDEETTIHQANEYISLKKIRELSKIYYEALKQISQ